MQAKRIFVAGHQGMVGQAVCRRLAQAGITPLTAAHHELDLREQAAVRAFMQAQKPDIVIVAAARVGGIHANSTRSAEFLYDNMAIVSNLVHESWRAGVGRLLYLGSSCIYPRMAPQPIPEDALLSGPLEPTNEGYAVAKIAGMKLCQHYRRQYQVCFHSLMPTNLYGPGDNYDPLGSHVLPALIRRFHEAKIALEPEVVIWGTGKVFREFLHVDDLADAIWHTLQLSTPPDWLNVGSNEEVSIGELAQLIRETVEYSGRIAFDTSKPDGTPRKLVDSRQIRALGWSPMIDLRTGLKLAYESFLREKALGILRGTRE
jgi:GDP-L-fucose synthase